MIVIRMNGEIEEKLKTIALLKGIEKDEILHYLEEKATEAVREEIERKYKEVITTQ